MAEERNRLKVLKEIESLEKKIGDFKIKNDMRLKQSREEEKQQLEKLRDLQKESNDLKLKNLASLASEEKSIGNISGSYKQFQQQQSGVLDIAKSLDGLNSQEIEHITNALDVSRDLADLTVEDKIQIEEKTAEFNKQLDALAEIDGFNQQILDKLRAQNNEATSLAGKTKQQKEVLDRSAQANEELKGKMQAFSENVQTALGHMKNVYGIMGAVLLVTGKVLEKFFEVNKTLGNVGRGVTELSAQSTILSFVFDDAASAGKELAEQLGSTDKVTMRLQTSTLAIAHNMGISASESATLLSSLTYLNNGSADTAISLAAGARSFAEMNNIPVASMMGDMAKSTEEFALFGKNGGKNIIEAIGYAKKLGVEMSQISGVADNLLDFESSITKELELSAMLGRNINLSKARQLMFDGKMKEGMAETLKQLGGIAEFEKMNYYQKRDSAALLGVSVAEMQKMITNQGSINDMTDAGTDSFSAIKEGVMAFVYEYGAGIVTTVAGLALLRSVAGGAGMAVGSAMTSIAGGVTSLGASVGGVLTTVGTGATTFLTTVGGGIATFLTSLGTGIAALLSGIAGGITALAAAATAGSYGLGVLALVALALSVAIIGIGFAIRLMTPAIEAVGHVFTAVFSGISSIIDSLGTAIGTVFGSFAGMLEVVSLEKAAAIALIGASFIGLAAGIAVLATAVFWGGGRVSSFMESIGSIDTSTLSRNANAVNNFATGIGRLNQSIKNLDTEKLEKLEDISLSLSVGAAVTGVASSIGGMIDSASDMLFGNGESGDDVNKLMLAELVLIKDHLATPRVIKIDKEKAGQEFASSTDGSSKNVNQI